MVMPNVLSPSQSFACLRQIFFKRKKKNSQLIKVQKTLPSQHSSRFIKATMMRWRIKENIGEIDIGKHYGNHFYALTISSKTHIFTK